VHPWGGRLQPSRVESLTVDMYETEDAIVVKTTLPGIQPEDINIDLTGDVLTIRGETKQEEEIRAENYIRRERFYGSFCRSLTIPTQIVAEGAEAEFENGVLTLTLPKTEEVKPKAIKVKVKK